MKKVVPVIRNIAVKCSIWVYLRQFVGFKGNKIEPFIYLY